MPSRHLSIRLSHPKKLDKQAFTTIILYAIKKPSPWQGKNPTRQRNHARAGTTTPDRSGRTTRNGAKRHEIPSPRNRIDLSSARLARLMSNHRRHLASHGTDRNRSSRRRDEGGTHARRDPPSRPMNKARIEQSTIHGEVLLSHTDLSRELDMRDGERMMEHTLALMVASSRALLGASPPAASAAAAGLRWGERNGRKAAAEGIYRWRGKRNPRVIGWPRECGLGP
ncbi:hypothetical protein HU200_051021 [Digitaria exilis]|uniref:Uncharacterized protein n=1 Tax=Digitaria exilis TaxID=1010633 RepID=A0A835E5A9_9POAL|nr:hypothetical protein HU200_051021 [Digitaria exilis]